MHPALSVIVFSTLSGAGLGTLMWLGVGLVPASAVTPLTLTGFTLTVVGLLASTLHLGRPERAWRALSQWRSSWLSREGIVAVLTLFSVAAYWFLEYPRWLGWVLAVLSLLTVFTTAMIYAQLRSVQQWNSNWTPAVFLFMSVSSGGLIVAPGIASGSGDELTLVGLMLIAAWTAKVNWWRRADNGVEISDAASATGLGEEGQVRMLESPHSGCNYLLSEMGFQVGRKHAGKLRRIAIILGGVLPLLAIAMSQQFPQADVYLLAMAVPVHLLGVLIERWLFFAQARHAVMSFYS